MIYVDSNGTKVADSDSESYSDLRSLKNALSGQSGTTVETLNRTDVSISYHPVKALHNPGLFFGCRPLADSSRVHTNTFTG